jgi:hypothetical protein
MTGYFPSLKLGRMVAFESLIEQDYLYVLEYEPEVLTFEEQPLSISYEWQGKQLKYTPDFLVVWATSHQLVECKPVAMVSTEENQRKFTVALDWCQKKGWTFVVVTDQELRSGYRLANIKLLTRYARVEIAPEIPQQVKSLLVDPSKRHTLLEIGRQLEPNDPGHGVTLLLHLAFHHRIQMSLSSAPITEHSQIWLAEEIKG